MGVPSSTLLNTGTISGGSGGNGGASPDSRNGNGGAGGAGVSAITATIVNSGTIIGGNGGTAGAGLGLVGTAGAGGVGITGSTLTVINSGTIAGGRSGTGAQANAITFTGGVNVLELQAGSTITGRAVAFSLADKLRLGGTSSSNFDVSTLGVQYVGFGTYEKVGSSAWTLTGTAAAPNSWLVTAGTLDVTGSIASSNLIKIGGGTLTGSGTVGTVQVSPGAIFSPGTANTPGTSMTVAGNLTLAAGSNYQVYLNPTTSTFANVTGTAALNGTVLAAFSAGTYLQNTYTILRSTGLTGTFSGLTTTSLPAGFVASLAYSANDASLNLTAMLAQQQQLPPGSLNQNQQSVAAGINNYFNAGGALPPNFVSLFNLSGSNLANSLSQLSGEAATGGRIGAVSMMNQFMGMMLDPCISGRVCGGPGAGGATPPRSSAQAASAADVTVACVCDLDMAQADVWVEPRWTAWGTGFGGGSYTSGNTATGASNVTANIYGFAAGLDYNYSRDTLVGVAVSGGGTNWGLGGGLGGGNSTSVQVGLYGMARGGPAYLSVGLAFANYMMTTNRSALGDQLNASFNAQSYGGRGEAGYRFAVTSRDIGVTPYGAVQYQIFHTPAYGETDLTGTGYGLAYNASDSTAIRTELGARFDNQVALDGRALTLRGRLAWAHDTINNPAAVASFQALPGSTIIVNGTTPASDLALVSVSGEWAVTPRVALLAKFDGEFSGMSQSAAGTASVRYRW